MEDLLENQNKEIPAMSSETFNHLPKEEKKEIIEKHNEDIKEYGLVVKDISRIKLQKVFWVISGILFIGVIGFFYFSYDGAFKSVCSQNVTSTCPAQVTCPSYPDCNCNPSLDCTFPKEINIKVINTTS